MQDIRFIAEKTLGKLSKWLRILGFDTLYEQDLWIDRKVDTGESGRILLTRTKAIMKQTDDMIFIRSDDPFEQIKEVIQLLGVSRSDIKPFSRCIRCNSRIVEVDKITVRGRVPDYVWEIHNVFLICKKCDKVYWPGSHTERSLERINLLFNQ